MITLEDLERLADELDADEVAQRSKLERLVRAYARILSRRQPELFVRRATEYADEDGHYDNSYPPKQVYRARVGPRLLRIRGSSTSDLAVSSGFYYQWKRVTEDPGLYLSRDGRIYGCEQSGTGRVGQFAAHPGDCNVEVTLEWFVRSELTIAELREAEQHTRALAFPLAQAQVQAQVD